MEAKDKKVWEEIREYYRQREPRGSYKLGILDYAELWATEMEERIKKGEKLEDIAGEVDRKICVDDGMDVTGFMHEVAVSLLFRYWIYGDALREWHNSQFGEEGEIANSKQAVLIGSVIGHLGLIDNVKEKIRRRSFGASKERV